MHVYFAHILTLQNFCSLSHELIGPLHLSDLLQHVLSNQDRESYYYTQDLQAGNGLRTT